MTSTNALGVDVSTLDVDAFLVGWRTGFPYLALGWLALMLWIRRAWWLLLGVLLANGYVWGITNYPLQRIYGLGVSEDRIFNLGLVQVVAAGNSPIRTAQVGQLHFEPLWGAFVGLISGWDPNRVLVIYPFLSLFTVAAFTLSVYFALRPRGGAQGWTDWERAFVAGFATLLSSAVFEHVEAHRIPWVQTFLLKPNHALGLVLLPWVVRGFAGIESWRHRLWVGLLLHLLGWAFVLHMAYACVGLTLFAAVSWLRRRTTARRDLLDVSVVIGVNLLVVSPYLVMLLVGYPFLGSHPRLGIPSWSPHLAEPTLRHMTILLLAVWGLRVCLRRGDRLSRVWAYQLIGGFAIWLVYLALGSLNLARERDEIYYWVRFLSAATAGIGAWDLCARSWRSVFGGEASAPLRAFVVGCLALPLSLPYWFDPRTMDSYFSGSLSPIPEYVRESTDYLRNETEPSAVVAGDPSFSRYIAALGARRILLWRSHSPSDTRRRQDLLKALMVESSWAEIEADVSRYGVRYLVVDRRLLEDFPTVRLEELGAREHLTQVFLHKRPRTLVAVFRVGGAV